MMSQRGRKSRSASPTPAAVKVSHGELERSFFDGLALEVSGFGPSSHSTPTGARPRDDSGRAGGPRRARRTDSVCELWDDYGLVEFLELGLAGPDGSSPAERVEAMREALAETDILEAEGELTDFLFHVARTRLGKIYVRIVRTMLLNRGNARSLGNPRLEPLCGRFRGRGGGPEVGGDSQSGRPVVEVL
jgi:hypothetical protein